LFVTEVLFEGSNLLTPIIPAVAFRAALGLYTLKLLSITATADYVFGENFATRCILGHGFWCCDRLCRHFVRSDFEQGEQETVDVPRITVA
jgi:hypothetical protein